MGPGVLAGVLRALAQTPVWFRWLVDKSPLGTAIVCSFAAWAVLHYNDPPAHWPDEVSVRKLGADSSPSLFAKWTSCKNRSV